MLELVLDAVNADELLIFTGKLMNRPLLLDIVRIVRIYLATILIYESDAHRVILIPGLDASHRPVFGEIYSLRLEMLNVLILENWTAHIV